MCLTEILFERVDWGINCLKMKYGDVGGWLNEEGGVDLQIEQKL
jgi:hypothetical protein